MKKILFAVLTVAGLSLFANGEKTTHKTIHVPRDKKTIQAAMDAAQSGDTVLLAPGNYREAVTLKSGVTLTGKDKKSCIISPVPGAAAAISAFNCESGTVENITVSGDGKEDNNIFEIGIEWDFKNPEFFVKTAAENSPAGKAKIPVGAKLISVNGCTLLHQRSYISARGAKSSTVEFKFLIDGKIKTFVLKTERFKTRGHWPDGIALLESSVNVNNCIITNIPGAGIISIGNGKPLIKNNTIVKNSSGINFSLGSHGTALNNVCNENKRDGIVAQGPETNVELRQNICNKNKAGINVCNKAKVIIKNSTCNENKAGINVCNEAKIIIKNNTCNENIIGLMFFKGASGSVSNNKFNKNKACGIAIQSRRYQNKNKKYTRIRAEWNICNNNKYGIACYYSYCIFNNNTCRQNEYGIALFTGTNSFLTENICAQNKKYGIIASGGNCWAKIVKNICNKNASGISIINNANTVVSQNKCNENQNDGISVAGGKTFATISDNVCNNNKYGIYRYKNCKTDIDKNKNSASGNKVQDFFLN
jgi:nitrous oxidase accessory protein NosD